MFSYVLSFDFYRVVKCPNKVLVKSSYISVENQMMPREECFLDNAQNDTERSQKHHFLSHFQVSDIFSEQTTMDDNIGSNTRRYQGEILKVIYFKKKNMAALLEPETAT